MLVHQKCERYSAGYHLAIHNMAGATNPVEAEWGTIRGDYGREWPDGNLRNIVHTSDEPASATKEIKIWFPEFEFTQG